MRRDFTRHTLPVGVTVRRIRDENPSRNKLSGTGA